MIIAYADADYRKAVETANKMAEGKYIITGGLISQMFLVKGKQMPFTIAWLLVK